MIAEIYTLNIHGNAFTMIFATTEYSRKHFYNLIFKDVLRSTNKHGEVFDINKTSKWVATTDSPPRSCTLRKAYGKTFCRALSLIPSKKLFAD